MARLEKEFYINVDWRGFELHPETPPAGVEMKRAFPEKASPEHRGYLAQFASKFGIEGMQRPGKLPNTRRPLAVAEYARDQGRLPEFRSLTMDARWKEGRDIDDNAVLADLARAAGLDPDKALAAADNPVYLARVDAIRIEYKKVGVGGIPTFAFEGVPPVEGCQPYEVVSAAAVRAGAKRR